MSVVRGTGAYVYQESPCTKAGLPTWRYTDTQKIELVERTCPLEGTVQTHGRRLHSAPD